MPTIGWFEILIVVAIAIVVLGPKDFPVMLKKVGSWIGTTKKYINNIQNEVSNIDIEENVQIDGNLTVDGSTNLKGNVDLGNATTDTITATGRFDSHLIPSADNTYDLGASSLEWRHLYIDGTAKIDTLTVDGNATIAGTLGVSGATTLSNTFTVSGNNATTLG